MALRFGNVAITLSLYDCGVKSYETQLRLCELGVSAYNVRPWV